MSFYFFTVNLHFLFIIVISFTLPCMSFTQPAGVARPAFLKDMLNSPTSAPAKTPDNKKNNPKKIAAKATGISDENEDDDETDSFVKAALARISKLICKCGGISLWNSILPEKVKKTRIVGNFNTLKMLSFITGTSLICWIVFIVNNNTELFFECYKIGSFSLNITKNSILNFFSKKSLSKANSSNKQDAEDDGDGEPLPENEAYNEQSGQPASKKPVAQPTPYYYPIQWVKQDKTV